MARLIFSPLELSKQIQGIWEKGLPPGFKTGWPTVDRHYTVVPGQLTVVTGWPGSGKSEWVDALMVNLLNEGFGFAIFSPENQPYELHVAKITEKVIGKPFGHGPTERMDSDELTAALLQLENRMGFIKPAKESLSLVGILEDATRFFNENNGLFKSRGMVIDPWNEIEHRRPHGLSETDYISECLTMLRQWARDSECHVWLVAHPQKLQRDKESGKLPVPRPDSISGSQNWWNKADVAITVHREMGNEPKQDVDIHVWKVRFKHTGAPGVVTLKYDRVTGRYFEPPSNVMDFKTRASGKDF